MNMWKSIIVKIFVFLSNGMKLKFKQLFHLSIICLQVNNIPGIEEVNMIKDDGTVIHFNNPKVQASLAANTFAVNGLAENKQITEMLPSILNQLGAESLTHLKKLADNVNARATESKIC